MTHRLLYPLLLFSLVGILYGPYLGSPTFFDDIYFFISPESYVTQYVDSWGPLTRRWVSYSTLALTWQQWGVALEPYRIGNLLLHVAVVSSMYLFVRDILLRHGKGNADRPAVIAAVLFSLHPVAAFAAGAIMQRSILMATLFSLWMWISVGRGVSEGRRRWLLLSVLFFYLAIFSKEHAVTALGVAILVAWEAAGGDWRRTIRSIAAPLVAWLAMAAAVVLVMRGVIGGSYEPLITEMDMPNDNGADMLVRSIVNQAYLWFKYILLWVIPFEQWMAVDLRLPFPTDPFAMPWVVGAVAYMLYPIAVVLIYRTGKLSRLTLLGLLSPWILFLVQFSAVQYQESFVLYRSYLWAAPAMALVGLGVTKLIGRAQWAILIVAGLFLLGLSWSRLQTLSMPALIWDESVERMKGRDDLPGAYRVYYNRAVAYLSLGLLDRTIADADKVIEINPSYPYGYNVRGAAYLGKKQYALALVDFDKTISLNPDYPGAYIQKGHALIGMGRRNEGLSLLKSACDMGYGCKQYAAHLKSAAPK